MLKARGVYDIVNAVTAAFTLLKGELQSFYTAWKIRGK